MSKSPLNEEQLMRLASTFSMEQRRLFLEAIKIVQETDAACAAQEIKGDRSPR